jgi:putative SbcD/Mre11-related phosphoesterase
MKMSLIPLTPYPALLVKTQKNKTLVITDLHIGWEMTLKKRGIHIPTQTLKVLNKLKNLIVKFKPKQILILGDIKHTVATAEISEWKDIPFFFNELKKIIKKIIIIRGNHDGNLKALLPDDVKSYKTSLIIDGVGFFHGHSWPHISILKCNSIVMGHVHPVIVYRDPTGFRITQQVWIKAKYNTAQLKKILEKKRVNKKNIEEKKGNGKIYPKTAYLYIMPSFNDFLGGKPINEMKKDQIRGPMLRTEAVDISNAEIYLLDGTLLGTIKNIKATKKSQFIHEENYKK